MNDQTSHILDAILVVQLVTAGDKIGAAKRALALGLDLVPIDDLRGFLDEAAAAKARAIVDEVERAKFGP